MTVQHTSTNRLATATRAFVVAVSLGASLLLGAGAAGATTLAPAADAGGAGTNATVVAAASNGNARSIMLVESKEPAISIVAVPAGHGPIAF